MSTPLAQIKPRGRAALIATVGAGAAAALISLTSGQEGVSLTPYNDALANDVATVCFGETNVQMRAYTLPECKEMLAGSLAGYAKTVRDTTPGFDDLTDGQKVAAVDLAYNAGLANYKVSTLRTMYAQRQFPAACEQFLRWRYVNGRDCSVASNRCSGIYKRRVLERAACLGE